MFPNKSGFPALATAGTFAFFRHVEGDVNFHFGDNTYNFSDVL
jgi:hypothetical protein